MRSAITIVRRGRLGMLFGLIGEFLERREDVRKRNHREA